METNEREMILEHPLPYIDPKLPFEDKISLAQKYRTRFGPIEENIESFYKITIKIAFREITLRPYSNATLKELKNKIHSYFIDYPPERQKLFLCSGRSIGTDICKNGENKTMNDLGIHNGSTIIVIYKGYSCNCQKNK